MLQSDCRVNDDGMRVPKLFWDYCRESPDKIAVIEPGIRSWSRGAIGEGSIRVRNHLLQNGLTEVHAVAIIAPNCAEFMMVYMGVTLLGARAVPVNFHLTDEEVAHIIRLSAASVVVVHSGMLEKASHAMALVGGNAPTILSIESLLRDPPENRSPGVDSMSKLLPGSLGRTMLFTSATTGVPKAVSFGKDRGYSSLERNIGFREFQGTARDSGAVHFCASTLYHAGPLEGAVVTLHMGNAVVIIRRWDVRRALQVIGDFRVTEMYVVPSMIVQVAKIPESERSQYDLGSLRMLIHGGAPCPKEAKKCVIDWFGPIVYEGYAASEGGGTFVSSAEWLKYPGTVGRAIPGAQITIRSRDGDELPPESEGLVYIRPYTGDRFEYLANPQATREAYVGDQFTVGDLGYLNAEGYLFLLDRAVNVIICAGANVYPAEIESVLTAHPFVVDCAVVGIPSAEFGETIHALIQPSKECKLDEGALRSEIIRFAYKRISPGKLPQSMEFVESIPRDPNGKLLKRRLSPSMSSGSARA